MKKRIIGILVITLMLMMLPVSTFAAESDTPAELYVTELTYSKSSITAGELDISCNIELLDENVLSQKYSFISVAKSGGKIISRDIQSGTISKGDTIPLVNTLQIPVMEKGYEKVQVESYFWDSLKNGYVLAPSAIFASQDNTLRDIYVNGEKIKEFNSEETRFYYMLPFSTMKTPVIKAIPSDSSANVTISEITAFPCDVEIKVTSASGSVKTYILKLSIEDGSVTNAYMKQKDGTNKDLTTSKLIKPNYSGKKPGDEGFDWDQDFPSEKTLVYTDRTMYYTEWPEFLDDAVAVQTSLQVIRYDEDFKNPVYGNEKMGGFKINRSANIYLYTTPALPAWAETEGYTLANEAKVKMYYANQGDKNPLTHTCYKRTVIVPEGETREVRIGGATSSVGGAVNDFYIIVDFISPTSIGGITNLSVSGVEDFVFDENKDEYNIILAEGTVSQPEIFYDVIGAGATVSESVEGNIPGKKIITVTSADGKSQKAYTFNFDVYTTKIDEIYLDGIAFESFNNDTFEYTVTLKNNWTSEKGLPVITATVSDEVMLNITQAIPNDDGEPMFARVEVSAEKGYTKEYIINFVIDPNPPLYPDKAELKTILIDNIPVDMQYVDNTNTYYKYLPYGSSYPQVIAAVEDETGAETEIIQASENNGDAIIKVTSYDETATKTYTVRFIISDSESTSAKYDFYGNILNDYYAERNSASNAVKTGLTDASGNYAYINAEDVVGTIQNYKAAMGIFRSDISSMADADLSGTFEMSIRFFALSIGETADKNKGLKAKISFYDMSDDMNWGVDDLDGTKSKDIEGNTSGKKPFASFEYEEVAYGVNIYQKLDVSEFIRKCIRENNLTPTIGLRLEMPGKEEFTYANSYARSSFTLYNNSSNRFIINYKK